LFWVKVIIDIMTGFDFFNHLFLPHHSNNQKPRLLHPPAILLVALFLLAFQFSLNLLKQNKPGVLGYASKISLDEVLRLTNEKRSQAGLSPLKLDPTLSQAAKNKGEDMLAKDYWAHVSPSGVEPWKFFLDVGYKYRYAGENLARDFSDAASIVSAWMASPTHRDNMLSPKYEDIGLAVVEGDLAGADATIVVQLFGTKLSTTGEVSPVAQSRSSLSEKTTAEAKTIKKPKAWEPQPTLIPTPQPANLAGNNSTVLEAGTSLEKTGFGSIISNVSFDPFAVFKGTSLFFLFLFLFVFVLDFFVVKKRNIIRISGRTWAHVLFLLTTLILVVIIKAGEIL